MGDREGSPIGLLLVSLLLEDFPEFWSKRMKIYLDSLSLSLSLLLKILFIYLFSEGGVGREKERERDTNVREKHWLPLACPQPGT